MMRSANFPLLTEGQPNREEVKVAKVYEVWADGVEGSFEKKSSRSQVASYVDRLLNAPEVTHVHVGVHDDSEYEPGVTGTTLQRIWDRATESERHGFRFGLFPVWMDEDFSLTKDELATLMGYATTGTRPHDA